MLGVIIVTFHSERTIERCLDAVFAELLPTDSITIVDNSENDLTAQTISRFKGRISVIRNESNLGYSIAANKGMAAQQCDSYLLLNPDTQLFPGWRGRLLQHLQDDRVGAVGPLSDNVCGRQFVAFHLPSIEYKYSYPQIQQVLDTTNRDTWEVTKFLSGQCLLLPDRIIQAQGGLDEDLVLGSDDLEISWRLRREGYELRIARDVLCSHIGQHSFDQLEGQRKQELLDQSTARLVKKVREFYSPDVPSAAELWGVDIISI